MQRRVIIMVAAVALLLIAGCGSGREPKVAIEQGDPTSSTPTSIPSPITTTYEDVLGRQPEPAEAQQDLTAVASGTQTIDDIASRLRTSREYAANGRLPGEALNQVFQTQFGRLPTQGDRWDLLRSLGNTDEFSLADLGPRITKKLKKLGKRSKQGACQAYLGARFAAHTGERGGKGKGNKSKKEKNRKIEQAEQDLCSNQGLLDGSIPIGNLIPRLEQFTEGPGFGAGSTSAA